MKKRLVIQCNDCDETFSLIGKHENELLFEENLENTVKQCIFCGSDDIEHDYL